MIDFFGEKMQNELIFVATICTMADDKTLIRSAESKLAAIVNPFAQELDSLRHDITLIHSDITSLTVRLDDGADIDAEALEALDQSAKLLLSTIDGCTSLTEETASPIVTEARVEVSRINKELIEIRNDTRRADALRRGIIPFAGGDGSHSVLSILAGAHSIGQGIFSFMTMIDSNNVRPVCVEFRQAIMEFPWMDLESEIKGSIKAWRAAFPVARALSVEGRQDIVDADFVHIRGDARVRLHTLDIRGCKSVTDAAFIHLRGIQKLYMSGCDQETITDAAFVHLRGIHELYMNKCNQATITDAAFEHLRGIHTLAISGCNQATITDAAFVYLHGIRTLNINFCDQMTITDAAFFHLRGIHTLFMGRCNQATITDAAFVHLRGIHTLGISNCNQATITDATFVHLRGIHTLYMSGCNQMTITDAAFVHLRGIYTLYMKGCNQTTITEAALVHLVGIKELFTERCSRDVRIAAAQVMGIDYESELDE